MHAMFFGIKRVHLRVLHISRGLLRGVELTPARFDMMRLIKVYEEDGIRQATIQCFLGVSAATVSRMLKSLEALGFIARERVAHDRRCVVVRITAAGDETLARAMPLVDRGIAERLALRGLGFARDTAQAALGTLQTMLLRIRRNYADPVLVEHPWKLQDVVPYDYGGLTYGVPLQQ